MRIFKAEISYVDGELYPWKVTYWASRTNGYSWEYLGVHTVSYVTEGSARRGAKGKLKNLRKQEAAWPQGKKVTVK